MRFVRLDDDSYARFAAQVERMSFTQLPAYVTTRRQDGLQIELVGVVDGDPEQIVAAGAVVFQPWKKVFRKANLIFGPTFTTYSQQAERCFYEGLLDFLRRDKRVVEARFVPPVVAATYDDVTRQGPTEHGQFVAGLLEELGAHRLDKDFNDASDIQMKFVYVKDITGMDFPAITKSVSQQVRTAFNRWGTNGVSVEFLTPDKIGVLEDVLQHTAERTGQPPPSAAEIEYYRQLATNMGEDAAFFPVAVLNAPEYLRQIATEQDQIHQDLADLKCREEELVAEGKQLSKKQRNRGKEMESRLEVLAKRAAETEQVRAEHGDEVVLAASFFVASPNELTYLVSGAYAEFNSYYGIYLIHRAMFEWAAENGIRWYNFYGMTGDFSEDASDAGVVHFKRQFVGDVEEYVGTYEISLPPSLARLAAAVD
ncbi:peptidoglycan bridge formation glycyltransferase FemA/FemB family protein [Trueperella bialowiezensis]|uniref:Aminoacyltransferase FemA n=1 Tax=Trueperella bialowiezensis TaxID=312285 RepID=A0A3S4YXM5_9ACTO|nr:peptidoglycan bridge formation glycyltransferase FemA/FemB family protein [Trueperella bialowiezensis]VEI13086.1 Aminoacyltransferase FemA [Trueperella bialowiezensis]